MTDRSIKELYRLARALLDSLQEKAPNKLYKLKIRTHDFLTELREYESRKLSKITRIGFHD